MILIDKKTVVNSKADVIAQARKLLNTKDGARVQKWIVNAVRDSEYVGAEGSNLHTLSFQKYFIIVESGKGNSVNVKEVRTNHSQEKDTKQESNTHTDFQIGDGSTIIVTDHAAQEALNDFPELQTLDKARNWVVKMIQKSELVNDSVIGVDEKPRRLYCFNSIAFIAEKTENTLLVVTTYKIKRQSATVRGLVRGFLDEQLQKLQRKERVIQRKNELRIAELELEKAELQLKIVKTRSEAKKNSCYARIGAIKMEIEALINETQRIKFERTEIAKGIVYYA